MSSRQAGETRSGVARAFALLGAFDERHRVLTLSALARRAELPVSTTHRLVADLIDQRVLVRRPDQSYEIGERIWQLGLLSRRAALREAALPHMQDLVAVTGQTAHLAVLDGGRALVLERLAGARTLPTPDSPGRHLPLHCTAVGKALLAHAPADTRERVLARLTATTSHTITEPRVLARQLDQVLRTGIARTYEENRVGVFSIAVPMIDHSGLVAAMALVAPLRSPLVRNGARPLRAAAAAVAQSLRRSA